MKMTGMGGVASEKRGLCKYERKKSVWVCVCVAACVAGGYVWGDACVPVYVAGKEGYGSTGGGVDEFV